MKALPPSSPLLRMSFPAACLFGSLILPASLSATNLYWDLNGATANAGVSATGAWNGTNAFWNTDSAGLDGGGSGTTQAVTTSADDLFFSSSNNYTSGTVTLSGAASANGVTFEEGAIILNGTATPSLTLGAGGLTFASGTGANTINTPLVLSADASFTQNDDSLQTIGGGITGSTAGMDLTVGGTGTGGVTITGIIGTNITGVTMDNANATLTLTGGSTTTTLNGNTYTGTTTLNAGTLMGRNVTQSVTNTFNAFGTSALVLNGGTLQLRANGSSASGQNIAGTNSVTIGNSPVTIDVNQNASGWTSNSIGFSGALSIGSGQLNVTGANSYSLRFSGVTTLTANATLNPTTANLTLVGAIGDGGNGYGITKTGTGTLTIASASNTYTGGTTLNEGTLALSTNGTLGSGSLAVNNNNTGAGTAVALTLATGANVTVGSLSGSIAIPSSGTNTATITTQSTRTFTVNQTANGAFAGTLAGSGSFALGATSTQRLTLNGVSSYTGSTTVNAGTLEIGSTGAINSTSGITVSGGNFIYNSDTALTKAITVNSGGNVGGTKTVAAITLNAGGSVSPGDGGAGTFNAASLSWNSNGTTGGLTFNLGADSASSDKLVLSGAFTKGTGSTFVFNFTDGGISPSFIYTLVEFGSTSFTDASVFSANGAAGTFALTGNSLTFTASAIPEPSTYAVLFGALTLAGAVCRRRSRIA